MESKNGPRGGSQHQNEKRTSSQWEKSTNMSFDDLLRCIYSQATYIENGMPTVINSSIFKA